MVAVYRDEHMALVLEDRAACVGRTDAFVAKSYPAVRRIAQFAEGRGRTSSVHAPQSVHQDRVRACSQQDPWSNAGWSREVPDDNNHPTRGGSRALGADRAFWLAMLAASAFGTNLGDLWTGRLGMPGPVAFGTLLVACGAAVWLDYRIGKSREAAYWFAIVVLRAAATNVADFGADRLGLGLLAMGTATAALALLAGSRTRAADTARRDTSPVIDGWYWTAMFMAGVLGTIAGDGGNHAMGVLVSAAVLTSMLIIFLALRARWSAGSMVAYWIVVLAERAAGTPLGDGLASRRGVGLGLPLATACTATLFGLALLWREQVRRGMPESGLPTGSPRP